MTLRSSSTKFYEVLDPQPLEQVGWYCKVLAESDYSTIIAEVSRFQSLEFLKELSGFGGFKVAIDKDDRVWSDTLPAGQTTRLVDQQAIWNIYEDGVLRGSFFAEDVEEDIVIDGLRSTVVTGRGTGSCLEWSTVLPYGYPAYTSLDRTFTGSLMSIWRGLFLEAQARGELTFVNLTFDGTDASTGDPWTDSSTITVQSGDNLLQLLTQWCEQLNLRWEMLPGFNLWVSDVNGNHLENKVLFPLGAQQRSQKRKRTRRDIANSLYVVGADNAIATAADVTSISKWRKRSRWVQAGSAADSNSRNQIGLATLGLLKDQKIGHEVRVDSHGPNRRVLVDYDVADWIQIEVEEDDQSDGILQVLGITLKVDGDGDVDLDLSVGTKWDARSVALQKLMDKLGGSQVSGSASSTPVSAASQVSNALATTTFGDLADVDLTPPPSDGDVPIWNNAASKWEPGPQSGGGGGPNDRRWVRGSTAHAQDDEFNNDSIDAAWIAVHGNGTSSNVTWTEGGDSLTARMTGGDGNGGPNQYLHCQLKAYSLAVGESIQTYLAASNPAIQYPIQGLVVSNSATDGSGTQYLWGTVWDLSNERLGHSVGSGFRTRTSFTDITGRWFSGIHMRMTRSATLTYDLYTSADGVSWGSKFATLTAGSGYTPTHVGVWCSGLVFSSAAAEVGFDYFRVV